MSSKRWIGFCILGFVMFFSSAAWADLVLSEGGPTGQWFNPERNGEGFYIEIIEGPPMQIGIAMYSYDENGDPLWVVGNVAIDTDDEIVGIPVFEFNGPVWGAGYDPADLNTIPFGTITVRFPTCDSALFSVAPSGTLQGQGGNYSLIRITSVEGVGCTEPVDKPPTGITTGEWRGGGVCFMVSPDGNEIVGGNASDCQAQAAFDADLEGISNEINECNVTTTCEGIYPIVNGEFTCANSRGELAFGKFTSNTSATGSAFEPEGGVGEYCSATWSATPN